MVTKVHQTICPMDCPDTCALSISVSDGKIDRISAGNDHPNTNGFICTKLSRFARRVYSSERLYTPLRNVGTKRAPEFKTISWDSAIKEITRQFSNIRKNWGGEAILPYNYGGSNGFLSDEFTDAYFFARMGASQLEKTLCAAPTTLVAMGMYGKMPGVAYEDFIHSKAIIIWGANPGISHIHLMPYIKKARSNGAFIVNIDPVKTSSSAHADLHLPVRPGTDLPLALAMINFWTENGMIDKKFIRESACNEESLLNIAKSWSIERAAEVCGVPAHDIYQLADIYAKRSPALIRCGWGLERNRNGGQAVAAILAMPALMGKFGIRGGGYTLSNSGFLKYNRSKRYTPPKNEKRMLNMTRLGAILNDSSLNPPIKSIFIYNSNPVATVPDQNEIIRGLQRDDLFTVVFDQVMTDSAQFANIILPATTFLEHHDFRRSYGVYHYGKIDPVIAPAGESRSNHQVFSALGRAMGWQDEIFKENDIHLTENIESDFQFYKNTGDIFGSGFNPVQFESVFPATSDGKINLYPHGLGKNPFEYIPPESCQYSLTLISPATNKTINSTMGDYNLPEQFALINPLDAAKRDIDSRCKVRIYNELGEVLCKIRISRKIREGVVMLPKGAWRKSSINGSTATALTPAHVNIVGDGACFNDAQVEVEKLV